MSADTYGGVRYRERPGHDLIQEVKELPPSGDTEDFRRLADGLPIFVWLQRLDGVIYWANRTWYEYVRLPPEIATTTDGWKQVVHPDDVSGLMDAFQKALQTGTAYQMEHRVKPADSDDAAYRWFLTKTGPIVAGDGRVMGWIGTGTDIDAERKATLRESFYARLGEQLSGTLTLDDTLRAVTQLIVPEFADWAFVTLPNDAKDLILSAIYHRDWEKRQLTDSLVGKRCANMTAPIGMAKVFRSAKTLIYERILPDGLPVDTIDPFVVTAFKRIGFESALLVPLLYRGRVVGALNAIMCGSGRRFRPDDIQFFEELARRMAPAIGNAEVYERERRVARSFQEAALEVSLPKIPGLVFDAVYQPGRTESLVGGDWYDAFRLPDGRAVLSVGDVAGSGLQAAVTMGSVRQSIRTAALINPDPEAVLDAVDRIVREMNKDQFITAFVGVLDPLSGSFLYASAGHPPAFLHTPDGTIVPLSQGELPLGLRHRPSASSLSLRVEAGSLLAIYTDGLTELDHDPLSGENKLIAALRIIANPRRAARELYYRILEDRVPRDDVAILTVSFERTLGSIREQSLVVSWEFDVSDYDVARAAREAFTRCLRDVGFTQEELSFAELIFGELLGNVVRYAPGIVRIKLDLSGDLPVLHVLDQGCGFEHNPRLPELMSERGRGLFIVTSLAEAVYISKGEEGGSHARAVLPGRIRSFIPRPS